MPTFSPSGRGSELVQRPGNLVGGRDHREHHVHRDLGRDLPDRLELVAEQLRPPPEGAQPALTEERIVLVVQRQERQRLVAPDIPGANRDRLARQRRGHRPERLDLLGNSRRRTATAEQQLGPHQPGSVRAPHRERVLHRSDVHQHCDRAAVDGHGRQLGFLGRSLLLGHALRDRRPDLLHIGLDLERALAVVEGNDCAGRHLHVADPGDQRDPTRPSHDHTVPGSPGRPHRNAREPLSVQHRRRRRIQLRYDEDGGPVGLDLDRAVLRGAGQVPQHPITHRPNVLCALALVRIVQRLEPLREPVEDQLPDVHRATPRDPGPRESPSAADDRSAAPAVPRRSQRDPDSRRAVAAAPPRPLRPLPPGAPTRCHRQHIR